MSDSPPFQWAVAGWKAYYNDEAVYDSDRYDWADLPEDGVQVIALYADTFVSEASPFRYRKLLDGDDYYYHVPDTDIYGSTNHTEEIPDDAIVKYGLEIPDHEFSDIKRTAAESSWP